MLIDCNIYLYLIIPGLIISNISSILLNDLTIMILKIQLKLIDSDITKAVTI